MTVVTGDRILRKALLRAPLSQWAERIERLRVRIRRDNKDQQLMVLYQTRLANLVKYTAISDAKARKFILREEVQISLYQVKQTNEGREKKLPCVALDVGDEWSAEKSEMLHDAGIEYIQLPAESESSEVIEQLERRLHRLWQSKVESNLLKNTSLDNDEFGKTAYIQQRLLPQNLRYLAQQSLSSILDVPDRVRAAVVERVRAYNERVSESNHRISEEFDRIATVDGVIVTPPPACVPVAIIEFDGSIHHAEKSDPESRKKVEKDKIKNGFFEKAKLPLIRIAEGGQVSKASKIIGEKVFDAFLGDIKRLMVDDEHQVLSAQEMLYAEVNRLGDEDQKRNLGALLDQTMTLLDEKAAVTARQYAESLKSILNSRSQYDPILDEYRYHDEPQWILDGFTSKQESQEAEFFQNYFYLLHEDCFAGSFFKRTIKFSKYRNVGWALDVEYVPIKTKFPSVNSLLSKHLSVERFVTDRFVPLTVFGSDEFKTTLQIHVEDNLYPDVVSFERELAGRLIESLSKGLGTLESQFSRAAFVNRLRKARTSNLAERYVEERVLLAGANLTRRTANELDANLSFVLKERMTAEIDYCIEALVEARPADFDSETIKILREALSDKIAKLISK